MRERPHSGGVFLCVAVLVENVLYDGRVSFSSVQQSEERSTFRRVVHDSPEEFVRRGLSYGVAIKDEVITGLVFVESLHASESCGNSGDFCRGSGELGEEVSDNLFVSAILIEEANVADSFGELVSQ